MSAVSIKNLKCLISFPLKLRSKMKLLIRQQNWKAEEKLKERKKERRKQN
jgi:hypothetical protein